MSNTTFRGEIRRAISDAQLQAALDANAMRRGAGRLAAFESLPDLPDRRKRAHSVRAAVMERLPEMLDAFAGNARSNGMIVHRADDARQALDLVLEIAETANDSRGGDRPKKSLLFAKSKSMVSEEIELNSELERRGHRVVETDLGEYIVQLRGEKPAHIITPAVHLLRGQVGELFREKLGLPYTEDIAALTAAARAELRQVFLSADVGVSGVNFGIVETGGICIVTNEGNGRMVTTIPRVHIALMGMERLVPTLQDLALMLSLLPRSATGQKLSVYTQLIHGPRRAGEIDGATQRHIVIVDNGRTRMWNSSLREALYCIRCGACLNACPVFREIGGHAYVRADGTPAPYPGPIGSIVSPGLEGLRQAGHLAQASSLCGACKDACPVDIDLPSMLTQVRAGAPEAKSGDKGASLSPLTKLALHVYTRITVHPRVFRLAQGLASLAARAVSPSSEWIRVPAYSGWGYSKDLLRPAKRPFRRRWQASEARVAAPPDTPLQPDIRMKPVRSDVAKTEETGIDLVKRLEAELEAVGAEVELTTADALSGRIAAELQRAGIRQALAWTNIEGLSAEVMAEAGVQLSFEPDPGLRAGITGCTCAVAETGTILVTNGEGQPLTASLLPEIHIAIVHREQIVASLEKALSTAEIQEGSASVLITGPSRTADIEMTLTIGVHGPKQLWVYVVDRAPATP